jgi:hypothetical protein
MVEEQIKESDADFRFLSLTISLVTAAWSQMGKIPHPVSKKIEKDLPQAQVSIEFLRMLQEKTKGNLKPKEKELLENSITDLELNYADETARTPAKPEEAKKGPEIITPSGSGKGSGPDIIKPS